MSGDPILEARSLSKTYRLGRVDVPVLRDLDIEVGEGEFLAVLGASGSGKSTLLHLLGGLDRPDPDGGAVLFRGRSLSEMSAGELDRYRRRRVGFVFQFYHLLPELTVLENVLTAAMVAEGRRGFRRKRGEITGRAESLLDRFGLGGRLRHRPAELSGGERQRAAIVRAMLNDPDALLADEPTGNLDSDTGASIMDAICEQREHEGRTIVLVTHDARVAARADRIVRVADGRLVPSEVAAVGTAPR